MSELHRAVPFPEALGAAAGSGDYYEKAVQCERNAAAAASDRMRDLYIEMAAQWRKLGDHLAGRENTSQPSSRADRPGRASL